MSLLVNPEDAPEGIECSKCGQTFKRGDQCYQLRLGYMTEPSDFDAEEDVEYYHATCPVPICSHGEDPVIPSVTEVMNSPVWKVKVLPQLDDPSYKDYKRHFHWKTNEFRELFLVVELRHKEHGEEIPDLKFAFVKCLVCGVIQSV